MVVGGGQGACLPKLEAGYGGVGKAERYEAGYEKRSDDKRC